MLEKKALSGFCRMNLKTLFSHELHIYISFWGGSWLQMKMNKMVLFKINEIYSKSIHWPYSWGGKKNMHSSVALFKLQNFNTIKMKAWRDAFKVGKVYKKQGQSIQVAYIKSLRCDCKEIWEPGNV